MNIVAAPQSEVRAAVNNIAFTDFEDCLQDKCAKTAGADFIVTANIRDFRYSEVRALTPDEFVGMMEKQ